MLTNKDAILPVVRAQIKTPLTERAKALGATFDKKAGAFVPALAATA